MRRAIPNNRFLLHHPARHARLYRPVFLTQAFLLAQAFILVQSFILSQAFIRPPDYN